MGILNQGRTLWEALFPLTRQRVLGLLFGHPDRSFFANEIVRIANVGTGSVQRELARLSEAGLVTSRRVGNQKHYQANRESPFFPEIRSLVVKTWGTHARLKEILNEAAGGVHLALTYGDDIAQLASPGTPLNILVVGQSLMRADLEAAMEKLAGQIDRPINLTLLSPDRYLRQRELPDSRLNQVLDGPHRIVLGMINDPGQQN